MSPVSSGRGGRGRGRARFRAANPLRREVAALLDGESDPTVVDPAQVADVLGSYPPLKEGTERVAKKIGPNDRAMLSVYQGLNDAVRNSPFYVLPNNGITGTPLRHSDRKRQKELQGRSLWKQGNVPWVYKDLCPPELFRDPDQDVQRKRRRTEKQSVQKQDKLEERKNLATHERSNEDPAAENALGVKAKLASVPSLDEMADEEKVDEGAAEPKEKKVDREDEDVENDLHEDQEEDYMEEGDFDMTNVFDDDDGYLSNDSGQDLPVL